MLKTLIKIIMTFSIASCCIALEQKVAIMQVTDHPALNKTTQGIIDALADAGFKNKENFNIRVESAQANSLMAAQIAQKFVAQNPTVVVGVGTLAAQSFIKYANDNRAKLVFSSVTDPIAANLEMANKQNIPNVTGVSNFVALEPQIQLIKQIQPNLKSLGIIYNSGEINSVKIIAQLEKICTAQNINLRKQAIAKTADAMQASVKLAGQVDAVFISNDNTALSSLQTIIKSAAQKNIPVYVSDTDAVAMGALAALGPNQYDIGKQTGKMIAQVLQGTSPSSIAIEYPVKTELVINTVMAKKLKINLPANLLKNAVLINHEVAA